MATDDPECLRPYLFHGVSLSWKESSRDALASECPFCGGKKFSVNIKEKPGKNGCFNCHKGDGSQYDFIRAWHEHCAGATSVAARKALCESRGYIYPETLVSWGVCQNQQTGEWMIPGYGADGSLNTLYKYAKTGEGMRLLPTPTLRHHLHGVNLYDPKKSIIALCEGPWDGIALWEMLSLGKWTTDGGLAPTGSLASSALADINVLAVPGCETFFDTWTPLFSGKIVWLLFDSDHPKEHNGQTINPAGYRGMQRVSKLLGEAKSPPEEIKMIEWGPQGFDPALPSGTDVRDIVSGKAALNASA